MKVQRQEDLWGGEEASKEKEDSPWDGRED